MLLQLMWSGRMNTGIGLITELGATFRNRSGTPGTGSALRISRRGSAIGVHDSVIAVSLPGEVRRSAFGDYAFDIFRCESSKAKRAKRGDKAAAIGSTRSRAAEFEHRPIARCSVAIVQLKARAGERLPPLDEVLQRRGVLNSTVGHTPHDGHSGNKPGIQRAASAAGNASLRGARVESETNTPR